jgi:hypothetical protein
LRRRFGLRHYDIVLCLAFRGWIHGGHTEEIILFGIELNRRLANLGGDSRESGFALRIGINAHIELVRAKRSVRQMDVNSRGVDRFTIRVSDGEFDGAWARGSVGNWDIVGLL